MDPTFDKCASGKNMLLRSLRKPPGGPTSLASEEAVASLALRLRLSTDLPFSEGLERRVWGRYCVLHADHSGFAGNPTGLASEEAVASLALRPPLSGSLPFQRSFIAVTAQERLHLMKKIH
jgi:hypothetical protein